MGLSHVVVNNEMIDHKTTPYIDIQIEKLSVKFSRIRAAAYVNFFVPFY